MEKLPAHTMPEALQAALMQGDLSQLSTEQKVMYYHKVCESVGLNPLTKPFDFMKGQGGKEVLYANKNATEQLRDIKGISINIVAREKVDSLYIVTARATMGNGRTDESIAAVDLGSLKGEALANACMKAETKAKRRVTLSIVGLGMLDETELKDNPQAFTPINVTPSAPGLEAMQAEIAGDPLDKIREHLERIPQGGAVVPTSEIYFCYDLAKIAPERQKEAALVAAKRGAKYEEGTGLWVAERRIAAFDNYRVKTPDFIAENGIS